MQIIEFSPTASAEDYLEMKQSEKTARRAALIDKIHGALTLFALGIAACLAFFPLGSV